MGLQKQSTFFPNHELPYFQEWECFNYGPPNDSTKLSIGLVVAAGTLICCVLVVFIAWKIQKCKAKAQTSDNPDDQIANENQSEPEEVPTFEGMELHCSHFENLVECTLTTYLLTFNISPYG